MSMLPKGADPCRCGPDQAELPVNLYPSSFTLLHHRPQMSQLSVTFPVKRWDITVFWVFLPVIVSGTWPTPNLHTGSDFLFWGRGMCQQMQVGQEGFWLGETGKTDVANGAGGIYINYLFLLSFFFSSSPSLPPSFPLFRHFSLPSFSILNIYLLLVRLLHNSPLGAASQTVLAGLMVTPSCPGMVTWLQENGMGLSGAFLWFLESEHPHGNLIHSRTRTPMFREGAASALERNLMHNKQSITISKERSKFPRLPSRHLDLKPLAPCHPSPSGWTQCCV